MVEPLPGVIITTREIYDAVVRLTGRVDATLDHQTHIDRDITDHESRLRVLEKARWPLPAVSIVIAVMSFGLSVVMNIIT
jgi:hypothetical protein